MTALSLTQTQRYFLDVLLTDGFDPTWQHVATSFVFPGELDPASAGPIAREIAARYPILSTRLEYRDGQPVLAAADDGEEALTVLDLRERSEDELDLALSRWADQPFDLGRGPLWRFAFVRGRGRTIFGLVCHHLVGDAAAVWLLAKDCILMHFGQELVAEGPSFADFAAEEAELLQSAEAQRRLEYWAGQLDGAVPTLQGVPRPRPHELSSSEALVIEFGDDAGQALQAEARASRVTPLPLLASKLLSAVRTATSQEDLLCGVVTDLRGQRFTRTVGPFTDLMLVRDCSLPGDEDSQRLASIRNAFFIGWQQQLPVAFLRDKLPQLGLGADLAGNPCDLLLNFLPAPPAAEWQAIMGICQELTPALYFARRRLRPPPHRFHPPLYIFLFALIERLDGWVYAHRRPELSEWNAAIASELQQALAGMTAAAT